MDVYFKIKLIEEIGGFLALFIICVPILIGFIIDILEGKNGKR